MAKQGVIDDFGLINIKGVVPVGGLEPPRIAASDFESDVSTISPHWHVFEEVELYVPFA